MEGNVFHPDTVLAHMHLGVTGAKKVSMALRMIVCVMYYGIVLFTTL